MGTSRVYRHGVCKLCAGSGAPTQVPRTVHGTTKDALRVAAELTVAPAGCAAGRSVSDVLDAWVRKHDATWAPASRRDQLSRVRRIKGDRIARLSVAIAAGHDVKTVADRLGHANAAMTLRVYAHAFAKSDRAVADSVGAMLEGGE